MPSYGLTKRGFKLLGILSLSLVGLLVYSHWHDIAQFVDRQIPPPLYENARAKEQSLPHYTDYRHKEVKYFFAANHFKSSGWGNVMQDFVTMASLAHYTNRSYVFVDYIRNPDGSRYTEYNGKLVPSRFPLSAIVGGSMVGDPWPAGDRTPLSVSKDFFLNVCPNPTILRVSDINTDKIRFNGDISAAYIFEKWVEVINSVEDPCLMLEPDDNPIFEYWMYGVKNRMLSIWHYLRQSPVVTHWEWSSIVRSAYKRNRQLFGSVSPWLFGLFFDSEVEAELAPISGLLALHVRRGDFEGHCVGLGDWSADWQAFNSFPEFRDKFERPADATSQEIKDFYARRCYPSIEQIVEKVRQVRTESADPLRYLYIMTNGAAPWVEELKTALDRDMEWDRLGSSRDLTLTWEEKFVSQALDILIYSLLVYRRYPPLYPQYHQLELELSHYASYEHSDVKYLWSPNHPDKVGWGNVMQDYILSYVLAHSCNRSFVFDDYTWANDGTEYSHFNGKLIPSRIPLNALIQGPLAGGLLPPGDNTPQAVHKDFFHKICPNPTILRLSDVTGWSDSDTVELIISKWVEKIASIEDPCLQFEDKSADKQIFNYMVYAQKDRLMSIWPYMSNLSALSQWGWSPLVHDAFEANREVIYPPASYWPPGQYSRLKEVMGGLLVMHVRRGDFSGHCRYLAKANAEWNTFNSFPGLPDKYDKVQSDPKRSSANHKAFMDHCYPSFEWIVEKVRTAREESQEHLEYIYIMTNGDSSWINTLKAALYDLGGWVYVGSNRDLSLTWEQRFVAQAVDMLVAQRAQVFIGNGWSSLSSNIVMLRTVDGLPPEGNRFW
ncbi:hypothetical protein JVU11DRAFT_6199 [Chiua virens]|nr:hypothetical protein JVU11DRAFT_9964 [Chiua virens]KAG9312785.1 hypothetical protein JVU11DRAFT_6199 [Chiua virens]